MPGGDHWAGFADFVLGETWAGGPSPNLKMIGALHRELGPQRTRVEETWLACCYAAIYNTSGAYMLYRLNPEWTYEAKPEDLQAWLEENKPGLPVHSNRRRTHGAPRKLAEGLQSLAQFALAQDFERGDDYDQLWRDVHTIDHVGRYFGIKLAGTLRELGLTEAAQYDIRGSGAKNGRRTLALLWPDDAEKLDMKQAGNSKRAVQFAERHAEIVKLKLLEEHDLRTTWFQLEALLCEYNQMFKGNRYPGKTSDADLDVLVKAEEHFGAGILEPVRRARAALLPPELVDTQKRDRLLPVYRDHGYVWIDGYFDDEATEDLSWPTVRSYPILDRVPLTAP